MNINKMNFFSLEFVLFLYCLYRLKADLEKKDLQHEEGLTVLQTQHSTEIKSLQTQLTDLEGRILDQQHENDTLNDRIAEVRRESVAEFQETIKEMQKRHDRERTHLEEENARYASDLEKVRIKR